MLRNAPKIFHDAAANGIGRSGFFVRRKRPPLQNAPSFMRRCNKAHEFFPHSDLWTGQAPRTYIIPAD